jgi:TRAP-type C4-dicarboxylate transport system permease small subunit
MIYRLLLLVLLIVLFKEGLSQAVAGARNRTTALEISWFWPYLSVPVGSGLMLVQMIFLIITDLLGKKTKSPSDHE